VLTLGLLDEYEHRLGALGVPIAAAFAPGLNDSEIDAGTAALPLELSAEGRVWWGWHNGTLPDRDPRDGMLNPGCYLLSLEQAVAAYDQNRALAEERTRDEGNPDVWWNPRWIPLLEPDVGATVACDCSIAPGEPSPLYVVWWKLPDYDKPPRRADSVGQMVEWWLEALDTGIWRYDRATRRWQRDWQAVPPERDGLI
jgi:hypothetical protein